MVLKHLTDALPKFIYYLLFLLFFFQLFNINFLLQN